MTEDPYPGKVLLTPKEVYTMLGVSKTHFYRKVKTAPGFPRPVSLAGETRYRKMDVARYLDRLPEAVDEPPRRPDDGETDA